MNAFAVVCLHSRLDHIERVHDQDFRNTGDGASSELVYERERLVGRHGDGGGVWNRGDRI